MRLVTFEKQGKATCGVRRGESIVDLSAAAPNMPGDWPAIFAAGALRDVANAAENAPGSALVPAESVTLLPPIPKPPKILCIGLNYRSHAEETGLAIPEHPIVFPRWPTSVVGHGTPIVCPAASNSSTTRRNC